MISNTTFLRKFGFELEGGYTNYTELDIPRGWRFKDDASLQDLSDDVVPKELISNPIRIIDMEEALANLVKYYPAEVNSTCGLHVHMSFHLPAHTLGLLLGSVAYQDHLLAELSAWGKRVNVTNPNFWRRLRGENTQYCAIRTKQSVRDSRYSAVNLRAYRTHGTIEVRVLPMFRTPELAAQAVYMVLQITHDYIADNLASIPPVTSGLDFELDESPYELVSHNTLDISPSVFNGQNLQVIIPECDALLEVA